MEDNPTPNFGGQTPVGSAYGQWTPTQPKERSGSRLAIALATIAALLGGAALVVALTRPTAVSPTKSTSPTYTAEESAGAHKKLCDAYKLGARAVQIDTNGDNPALAGVATINAAVMLEQAINGAPALSSGERAAALTLAEAYTNATAMGSWSQRDDPAFRSAVDDVNAKDAAMKTVCGGG